MGFLRDLMDTADNVGKKAGAANGAEKAMATLGYLASAPVAVGWLLAKTVVIRATKGKEAADEAVKNDTSGQEILDFGAKSGRALTGIVVASAAKIAANEYERRMHPDKKPKELDSKKKD